MRRDKEYQLLKANEGMREELEQNYQNDIRARDELIELLRAKLSDSTPSKRVGEPQVLGGRSRCYR